MLGTSKGQTNTNSGLLFHVASWLGISWTSTTQHLASPTIISDDYHAAALRTALVSLNTGCWGYISLYCCSLKIYPKTSLIKCDTFWAVLEPKTISVNSLYGIPATRSPEVRKSREKSSRSFTGVTPYIADQVSAVGNVLTCIRNGYFWVSANKPATLTLQFPWASSAHVHDCVSLKKNHLRFITGVLISVD